MGVVDDGGWLSFFGARGLKTAVVVTDVVVDTASSFLLDSSSQRGNILMLEYIGRSQPLSSCNLGAESVSGSVSEYWRQTENLLDDVQWRSRYPLQNPLSWSHPSRFLHEWLEDCCVSWSFVGG